MVIRDDLDAERDLRLSASGAHVSASVAKPATSVLKANAGLIADQDGFLESVAAAQRLLTAEASPDEAASGS
jgi:starvation-inducible outer membrane lipoprotein